ncbi:MAG: hypothetical protein ABWY23_08825 [Mycetocola sp.]
MNTEPARSEPDSPSASPAPSGQPASRQSVRVRRTPKFANFVLLGALFGAIAAFVLTVAIPPDAEYARANGFAEYSQLQIFGFLLLIGLVVGIAIALTVAILLDRRNSRRSTVVEADRVDVREVPEVLETVETDAFEASSAPAIEQNPPQATHTTNEGNA